MRIVIVDGNASDRAMIEQAVTQMNMKNAYGITYALAGAATDGKEGYEMIRAANPDLIIMDMQLSRMKGLSMLKRVRDENIKSRVIVLTADRDFKAAQQAIGLGVDDYLLKPVKKPRLEKAILTIAEKLEKEKVREQALSAENIFMGCINGQLHPNRELHEMTRERYGFAVTDPGALFVVRIGNEYAEQRDRVRGILENAGTGNGFSVCVLPIDTWHMLAAMIYRTKYKDDTCGQPEQFEREYGIFRDHIVPSLNGNIRGEMVCLWEEMERMSDLPEALRRLRQIREWNLLFDRGEVIRRSDIEELGNVPLKYPAELEIQVRQAVLAVNIEEIKKGYYRLYDIFRREPYHPREIKECMIRFNMAVVGAYKTQHEVRSELELQHSMQQIADAMSWAGIRKAMDRFFQELDFNAFDKKTDKELSPLIKKAVQLVGKFYDQGITLEEMAARLFVSEEYLSAQFKKETGKGFAETVRALRIDRIKSLLVSTHLKLNQIAELTGYTDPKYMSRVFKEEVGMLPTEFRKSAH